MLSATYNGREYQIPEIWLAGFLRTQADGRRIDVADAIAWWAYQCDLAEQEGPK